MFRVGKQAVQYPVNQIIRGIVEICRYLLRICWDGHCLFSNGNHVLC